MQPTALDIRLTHLALLRSGRAVRGMLHDLLAPICRNRGITEQHLFVLAELAANGPCGATLLSERTGILRTNFALVCRRMERMGLVEHHGNPADRRSKLIGITSTGRNLLIDVDRDASRLIEEALASIPESVIADAERGIAAVAVIADALHAELHRVDAANRFEGECLCSDS